MGGCLCPIPYPIPCFCPGSPCFFPCPDCPIPCPGCLSCLDYPPCDSCLCSDCPIPCLSCSSCPCFYPIPCPCFVLILFFVLVVLCFFRVLVGNPKEKCICGCPNCPSPCFIPYFDCFCLGCPMFFL